METRNETIELAGEGMQFQSEEGWFRVFGNRCQRLTSDGPQCGPGCKHVQAAAAYFAAKNARDRHLEIECPDCRARAVYDDQCEAYERGTRNVEPDEPKAPPMDFVCHDEYRCRRCGNVIVIPDL